MNLSEGTKKVYKKHINKYYTANYPYDDPAKLYNLLIKTLKITSIKPIMYAMLYNAMEKGDTELFNKYKNYLNNVFKPKASKEYEKDVKEKYKDIKTRDEYSKMLEDYFKNTVQKSSDITKRKYFVIASLYTLMTPRRLLDYAKMKYAKTLKDTTDDNFNYYLASKNIFIFNKYKTANTYGSIQVKLNQQLSKILKAYIKTFNIQVNELMFSSERTIERALIDVYGVSVNWLRHSDVNEDYEKDDLVKIEKRKQKAREMGHNMETHEMYVTKKI